jgi:type I restriction enzyme S subunit
MIEMSKVPKLRFPGFSGEWEAKHIGETLKIKHGKDQKSIQVNEGKYPILATGGEIGRTDTPIYDKESVLIGRKGTIDRPVFMNEPFWTVDTLFYSEIKKDYVAKFLYYCFQRINWKKYSEASGVPSLSAATVENIKYNVPHIKEQKKISAFFSLVDEKIQKQQCKVEALHEYKKGIMQKIFSQEIRFKDENGEEYPEWENCEFNKIFNETNVKTSDTKKYPLYSLTIESGVVPKTERYEREFLLTKDEDNFKIVKIDEFVYNPMNLRFGAIARHKSNTEASVSGYYNIFKVLSGFSARFFEDFLKTERMMYLYNTIATGSLIEKRRVHLSQFLQISVPIPSKEEQHKIAEFIAVIDRKIAKEQEKLDSLNLMKKCLLQQMFV